MTLRLPGVPPLASFALDGVAAALVGVVASLPSLRIKGFYLVVNCAQASTTQLNPRQVLKPRQVCSVK